MGTGQNTRWICQMAELLVREITQQMSGIQLEHRSRGETQRVDMDSVCGLLDGDYPMNVQFRAEPRLFRRLARNMIGAEPENEEEVREYALEFFNVLCGRFISEIYRTVKPSARLRPAQFKLSYQDSHLELEDEQSTLCFSSEEQELAEFIWTNQPVEQLLKRSGAL